jgi:hypothetical protein
MDGYHWQQMLDNLDSGKKNPILLKHILTWLPKHPYQIGAEFYISIVQIIIIISTIAISLQHGLTNTVFFRFWDTFYHASWYMFDGKKLNMGYTNVFF